MKIGVVVEPQRDGTAEFVQQLEQLGVDSVWAPEIWGYDALTGLAFLAARTSTIGLGTFVVQLGSRSPALLATSALSLQKLSGDRFRLGVGVSGPAVMEGWHGVRFTKPVQTTRETIEIARIIARGDKLAHDGEIYPLPLPDSRGAALRPALDPAQLPARLPIYVAAMGPANLRLTGEVADGWLGNAFIPESSEVFLDPIREGARSAGRDLDAIDLVVPVALEIADDEEAGRALARKHADGYAFTIGAMGAGGTNFYNEAFARLGFGPQVAEVARLWKAGDRGAAAAGVPLELGELTNLVGTPRRIAARLPHYRDAGVGTLLAKLDGPYDAQLASVSTLLELVASA